MANSYSGISRRGFCLCCLSAPAVAAGAWLTPRQAFAEALGIVQRIQAAAATTPIAIHTLRGGLAVLEGSGGNVAVLSGPDGKVLIDAGIAVSQPQVATALATLGPEPVTHLINTHWHFDHTNGNEWLHESSPSILAHENTRKHLLTTQRVEDWSYDFLPLSAAALPTDLMTDERNLTLNKTSLALKYYGPAHTDSDISVHFKEPDVLHTGDTFWNGIYPFIDYSTGGSIDGSIRAADANLELATGQTIIIPGHGQPVSNRSELRDFRDMLVGVRSNVAALKENGHSLEAIVSAKPTAAYDAKWAIPSSARRCSPSLSSKGRDSARQEADPKRENDHAMQVRKQSRCGDRRDERHRPRHCDGLCQGRRFRHHHRPEAGGARCRRAGDR